MNGFELLKRLSDMLKSGEALEITANTTNSNVGTIYTFQHYQNSSDSRTTGKTIFCGVVGNR